jgi:hypothetical protein
MFSSLIFPELFAVELLSKDQALKRMFLTAESVSEDVKSLTPAQLEKVKGYLGGKIWAIKPTTGIPEYSYTFYFGVKAGQKTGVALIEEQEDKWGLLTFIIVLDPSTGKVINAAMMKYIDGRARTLANRAFLKEYFEKGIDDPITIGKDIDAVAGATVSCEILSFMVKKVIALYKIAYLEK